MPTLFADRSFRRPVSRLVSQWLSVCIGLVPALAAAAPVAGEAGDWILLSSDASSSQFISATGTSNEPRGEVHAQVKTVFRITRDMMGLSYNASLTNYRLSCASDQVLSRQQFLLDDDAVVWTFPEAKEVQSARRELSEAALRAICPAGADRAN